ncbi:mnd1 family protein, related [Neospora caninum Liverpool]|uniref:Mnd1 family protein, related n=1 Tax=Neospora caninum (strain Liverpool) TaxID=572307 RepID=F0VC79_NEOCL|nr:mnd1 family protein, related [Neospora caninum Liverpool]CBZ51213.1 mnd1 family protein, related [Neospora caninum Liverpool]CEL68527.1 TPA: Mnd1 family protein, related [Neospora caninum Liverpool]|eukprot:XP_003881246.1 mnd1 family protein, related [Neospora caninum Liverpool]
MAKSKQTAEDRLRKFHELVLESQSFYGSKELEKMAEKAGYRSMQAKDAIKMLLDENLIKTDKIGSSSVFWELKSEATAQRQLTLEKLMKQKASVECALNSLKQKATDMRNASPEEVLRAEELSRQLSELKKHVSEAAANDPGKIQTMIQENAYARDALVRWTDNICCLSEHYGTRG